MRRSTSRYATDVEYSVAELEIGVAAVMHYRYR
jgi:hypothetical protein